jgi:NhaP-type Na+/H+ or K+/H+ antiporter
MRICAVIVMFCVVFSPSAASAQHHITSAAPPRLIISEKVVADALTMEQPVMRERRDSVKNGAVIGAIIGAIALGGFVGWLCNALQEPSDPSCVPGTLLYTGIGAGIGAAGGAGIDALFMRSAPGSAIPPGARPPAPRWVRAW